jgi:arylsulfatase A-like enzyme
MINKSSLLLVCGALCLTACQSIEKPKETEKPNIIYLIADDLGYGDLSLTGQEKFKTPNIDKLASEGMIFSQHYSGSTVCAPSRASLFTGLHIGHCPVRGNKEWKDEGQFPLPDSVYMLSELLHSAGYVTGGFGKWGMGYPGSVSAPENVGFDEWFGYNCQRLAHNYYPEYLYHNSEKVFLEGNKNNGTGDYAADLIHEKALEFIRNNKENSFFLFLPYTIPHAELLVPEDSTFESFKGKFPETPYKGTDDGPKYRKGDYGSQEDPHAAFAAMVVRLDDMVGDIMNELKELGLEDNTLLIFTSDNGPHMEGGADPDFFDSNGPYKGYKRDLYEGGIHMPMIARWPSKIKAGSQSDHISAFWDIYPTFSEIAGVAPKEAIDGISFLPTLTGEGTQKEHEYLYWEFYEKGGRQAIRYKNWKAIRYNIVKNPESLLELYDLSNDPGETKNLASEYPEIVEKLDSMMRVAHVPDQNWQYK